MKKNLISALEKEFGEDLVHSKRYDYVPTETDLKRLYRVFNAEVFNGKLPADCVTFAVFDYTGQRDKGSFGVGWSGNCEKQIVSVVKYASDNFSDIVNVFAHELIHVLDFNSGDWSKLDNKTDSNNSNGRCMIGNYDTHGKWFQRKRKAVNAFGLDVSEKYNISKRFVMKKIKETVVHNNDAHAFFGENEDVSRDPTYAKVKAMYDALKNCHKQMVYRDPGNWFIAIA